MSTKQYFAVHMQHETTGERRCKKVLASNCEEANMKTKVGYGTPWIWKGTEPFHHISGTAFPVGGGYYKLPKWDMAAYEKYKNSKKTEAEIFENFILAKNDLIYEAAHNLIAELLAVSTEADGNNIEWNMENIGLIVDAAEEILIANGLFCCYPYRDENEILCYKSDGCTNPNCPFRSK